MSLPADRELGEGEEAARAVAAYLRRHPDFFADKPDLLVELTLPHGSGAAVSLVERQVAALRKKYRQLEARHRELVEIAQENDELRRRLHHLILRLLGAREVGELLETLRDSLVADFRADFVALRLYAIPREARGAPAAEFVGPQCRTRRAFSALFEGGRPVSGPVEGVQRDVLFGESGEAVGSAVLVPLARRAWSGVLAVGSRDPRRFYAGIGVDFLTQLAEIASQLIDSWVAE